MRGLIIRISFLSLFALASNCGHMIIEDTEVCAVAGLLSSGADCAHTLTDETRRMNLEQFIEFLEPSEDKGGALCQSVSDWNKNKTSLEIACRKLGKKCSYEVKEFISRVDNLIVKQKQGVKKMEKIKYVSQIPIKGMVGVDVSILQEALKKKGFSPGTIDGIYGPKTEQAVKAFQKSIDLPGGGIIGPKTLKGLGLEVKVIVNGKPTITRDLKGKKSRFLHPQFRALLEQKVFPQQKIPRCFREKNIPECLIRVAKKMEEIGIYESGGNNRGKKVGYVQGVIGPYHTSGTGDPWCLSAVQCMIALIEDFFQVESPCLDSEHCVTQWRHDKKVKGLTTQLCEPGTMFLWQRGRSASGHAGVVIENLGNGKMITIEGNTGNSSIRDGGGLFLKKRDQKKNGTLKTLGFVRLYANNELT